MSNEELVLDGEVYKFYVVDDVLSIRSQRDQYKYRSDIDIRRIIAIQSTTMNQSNRSAGIVVLVFGLLIAILSFFYSEAQGIIYLGALLIILGIIILFIRQKEANLTIDVEGETPYVYKMEIDENLVYGFQDKINEVRKNIQQKQPFY